MQHGGVLGAAQPAGHPRGLTEGDDDLLAGIPDGLSGPQCERHPGPAPGVGLDGDLGKRLRLQARVHSVFVHVGGQVPVADRAGGVAGASARPDGVLTPQPDRPYRLGFRGPQLGRLHGGGCLHGDQRHDLQQVALEHVDHRSGAVVVPGAALQAQLLVVDDLHAGDVVAVPQRLEQTVGETHTQHVEHRGSTQEMVDPEHLLLGHELRQQTVELHRAPPVGAEGLLQHQHGPGGQLDLLEGLHRLGRHGRGQGEVQGRDPGGGLEELLQVLSRGRVRAEVTGVRQCVLHSRPGRLDGVEGLPDGVGPLLVTARASAGADQADPPVRLLGEQPAQARQQQPGREVTGAAKDDQSRDSVVHRCA